MKKEFLPWREEYSVNVVEIDNQHKMLVRILNDLYKAFMNKEQPEIIDDIIKRLKEFAQTNFTFEEKYFVQFKYLASKEHMQEHKNFIEKIKSYNNDPGMFFMLINFLKDWLNHHILVEDKKYISCFNSNGLK